MNEDEVKKHLFAGFCEWMRGRKVYFDEDINQYIFTVKDVGAFTLGGMKADREESGE